MQALQQPQSFPTTAICGGCSKPHVFNPSKHVMLWIYRSSELTVQYVPKTPGFMELDKPETYNLFESFAPRHPTILWHVCEECGPKVLSILGKPTHSAPGFCQRCNKWAARTDVVTLMTVRGSQYMHVCTGCSFDVTYDLCDLDPANKTLF